MRELDGGFGFGGTPPTSGGYPNNGGGGGWFGGGACRSSSEYKSASGGSSYALTASSFKPDNYTPTSEWFMTDIEMKAGNQSFPAPGGGNETGHSGNGYARITLVE